MAGKQAVPSKVEGDEHEGGATNFPNQEKYNPDTRTVVEDKHGLPDTA